MLKDADLSCPWEFCVRSFCPSLMPCLKLCSKWPHFDLMILQRPEHLSFARGLIHSFWAVSSFCLNSFVFHTFHPLGIWFWLVLENSWPRSSTVWLQLLYLAITIIIKPAHGQVQCGGGLLSLFVLRYHHMQNIDLQIDLWIQDSHPQLRAVTGVLQPSFLSPEFAHFELQQKKVNQE